MRLILHVGVHRTATNATQSFLHRNQDRLLRRGIILGNRAKRHFITIKRIFDGHRAEVFENMKRQMAETDADTLILTDEDTVMNPDFTELRAFADYFDEVQIVIALRRQDLWLESWYLQNIKWQWNPRFAHATLEEFLAARDEFFWIHYGQLLDSLVYTFGSVTPFVFERGQMEGGPIATFCRAIGIDDIEGWAPAGTRNQSLSPQVAEFVRRLPFDRASEAVRTKLEKAALNIDSGNRQALLIPHDKRAAIMAEYDDGNTAVAKAYFGRKTLFFEPLPAPDEPVCSMDLPDAETLMNEIAAPYFNELVSLL